MENPYSIQPAGNLGQGLSNIAGNVPDDGQAAMSPAGAERSQGFWKVLLDLIASKEDEARPVDENDSKVDSGIGMPEAPALPGIGVQSRNNPVSSKPVAVNPNTNRGPLPGLRGY